MGKRMQLTTLDEDVLDLVINQVSMKLAINGLCERANVLMAPAFSHLSGVPSSSVTYFKSLQKTCGPRHISLDRFD